MKFIPTADGDINISAITRISGVTNDVCTVHYEEGGRTRIAQCHFSHIEQIECETVPCPAGWYAIELCDDDAAPSGYEWDSYPVIAWRVSDVVRSAITHVIGMSGVAGYITPEGRVIDSDGEPHKNVDSLIVAIKRQATKLAEKSKRAADKYAGRGSSGNKKPKKKSSEADE